MLKKVLLLTGVVVFAFVILTVSVLESSSVSYSFTAPISPTALSDEKTNNEVNYIFPYAGRVLPDSPFWRLKALRDKVWYFISPSPLKKAELALLFSDKRLVAAKELLEDNKIDLAISTLTKGEKYLETAVEQEIIARSEGFDTSLFLNKLILSSLKHREIIENLMPMIPEEGRPLIVKTEDYSKNAYKAARDALNSKALPLPFNPFDGD
jgi:hypothetical protein